MNSSLKIWLNQFKRITGQTPPLDLYFLGDGLGESIIGILENNFCFVIDAFGGTEDSITKTVLKNLGITKIDFLQVSHLHKDHYAGLNVILNNFGIEGFGRPNLVKYQEITQIVGFIEIKENNSTELKPNSLTTFLRNIKSKHKQNWADDPNKYLHLGNSSQIYETFFNGIKFKIDCVAPLANESEKFIDAIDKAVEKLKADGTSYLGKGFLNKFDPEINRTSVVNRIAYGHAFALLTGDTESKVIDAYKKSSISDPIQEIKTVVVKIPHHGSDTSDAELFFKESFISNRKKIAVLTPYDANDLPLDEVVEKYIEAGYEVYRTSDSDGKPSLNENSEEAVPDGIVHIRLESNGEASVSTWGTARKFEVNQNT